MRAQLAEERGEEAQTQAQVVAAASSDGAASTGGGRLRSAGVNCHLVLTLEELTKLLKKCSRAFSLVRRRLEDCWGEEAKWPRKEPCGDEQRENVRM